MGLRVDKVLLDLVDRGIKINGDLIVKASFVKGLETINVLVTTCERREYGEKEDKNWYEDKNGFVRLWVVVEGYGEKHASGIKPFQTVNGNASDHVSIKTFIKNGFRKDLF
tara:strand:- start:217 stop:549 length:333 start_codon:yes stop_codon:yes gene_type:complete